MARVCILSPYHYDVAHGGAEFRARLLAEHLAERTDHEVVYLARYIPAPDADYPYRISGFQGPRLLRSLKLGRTPDSVALYRALADIDPDVIVQFVACAYTGVAAFYAGRTGKPLIWCLASDMDVEPVPNVGISSPLRHLDRALFRYGVRNADCVLAQTSAQANRIQTTFGRAVTAVIPNFHPVIDHAVEKGAEFRVLWVANLKPLKRPELFLDLAEHLAGSAHIRLRMIGRAEDTSWCQAVVERISRLDNVEYLGGLTMDEVNQELEAAHLFVNTSEYEGMPNTFIQAWLREVPTLTLGVDPDGVIVQQGLGVVAADPAAIARSVHELFDDRDALRAMGEHARRFAEANYSMRNLERFVEVIDHALGGDRRLEVDQP